MAGLFNEYLANFLRTGNSNGESLDLWDTWTPDHKISMIFDGTETEGTAVLEDVSSSYEEIIQEMEANTSISAELKVQMTAHVMNGRWFSGSLDEYMGMKISGKIKEWRP